MQPATDHSATCILFLSGYNRFSQRALERLYELLDYSAHRMRGIVVLREEEAEARRLIAYAQSHGIAVTVDAEERFFRSFGVEYAPYLMLTDLRNRVVWVGNPTRLTTDVVDAETTRVTQ